MTDGERTISVCPACDSSAIHINATRRQVNADARRYYCDLCDERFDEPAERPAASNGRNRSGLSKRLVEMDADDLRADGGDWIIDDEDDREGSGIEAKLESAATAANSADTRPTGTRLYHAALLVIGAVLAGVAYAIAGWLVGLFGATLPLPPGVRLAVTVGILAVLVYYVALDTNDEGETLLRSALGRLGGGGW